MHPLNMSDKWFDGYYISNVDYDDYLVHCKLIKLWLVQ